jgi:hypothetical protein
LNKLPIAKIANAMSAHHTGSSKNLKGRTTINNAAMAMITATVNVMYVGLDVILADFIRITSIPRILVFRRTRRAVLFHPTPALFFSGFTSLLPTPTAKAETA